MFFCEQCSCSFIIARGAVLVRRHAVNFNPGRTIDCFKCNQESRLFIYRLRKLLEFTAGWNNIESLKSYLGYEINLRSPRILKAILIE